MANIHVVQQYMQYRVLFRSAFHLFSHVIYCWCGFRCVSSTQMTQQTRVSASRSFRRCTNVSTTTTARMGPSPSHNWFLEKCKKKTACWILFQVGLRSPGIMRRPKLSCGAPAAALQGVINAIMLRGWCVLVSNTTVRTMPSAGRREGTRAASTSQTSTDNLWTRLKGDHNAVPSQSLCNNGDDGVKDDSHCAQAMLPVHKLRHPTKQHLQRHR